MDAVQPRVRGVRRRCAPQTWPCPRCGRRGRRKQIHARRVRDLAYHEILIFELRVGEYRARRACRKTLLLATDPPGATGCGSWRGPIATRKWLHPVRGWDSLNGFMYEGKAFP
jgi:hypothetical protein